MADRSIKVRLSANVTDFTREMGKATTSLDDLVKKSGDASGASNTTMGRLAQSARLQSDAWNTAGASLLGVGAAITGVNVAVAKTGIEYNTLQQKSRAALTTILGGAQQANEQMDKLDEFARTSPFSKAVFIEAQQQMLGFGIEAQKVIPYLSAINETIAATGGNNHDLAEIVRIFSQISAAGKITATDLMQFGQRGVDAATLIGSQMGMTGAQIRESITNGTLDANAALDALADGMQARFEGASAGVKNTMEGAFDRVKAAWRDLSASIMEPAVGAQGGGFLVDMTNSVADLLRAIEKLPQPVKSAAGALSGIAGATALVSGSLLVAVPKIVETHAAWQTLGTTLPGVARVLGGLGPAAVAAGVAIAAIGKFIQPTLEWHARAREVVEEYSTALAENTDLLADNAAATDESIRQITAKRLQDEGLLDIASKLGVSLADVTSAVLGEADALERVQGAAQAHVDGIEALIAAKKAEQDALAAGGAMTEEQAIKYNNLGIEIEELGRQASNATGMQRQLLYAVGDEESRFQKGIEGARELKEEQEQLEEAAAAAIDPTQQLADAVGATGEASLDAAAGTRDFAAEAEAAAEAAAQLSSDVRETLSSLNDYFDAAVAASDATIAVERAFDKASDAVKKNGENLDVTTEKGRENMAALNGIAQAADRQTEALIAAGAETEDITAATQRAREKFIEAATAMTGSSEEAEKLADKYGLIPELVLTRFEQPGMEMSQEEAQAYRQMLASLPPEVRVHIKTIPDLSGYYDVNRILNKIEGRTVTTYVAMKQYGQGLAATGGRVGDTIPQLADGGSPRWVGASGRVFGPGSPTGDKVSAWISPDEFVVRARTAQRLGYDAMYALNAGRVPREALTPYLAAGGTPSVVAPVTRAASVPAQGGATVTAHLSREDIDLLARTVVNMAQGVSHRTVDSALMALGRGI